MPAGLGLLNGSVAAQSESVKLLNRHDDHSRGAGADCVVGTLVGVGRPSRYTAWRAFLFAVE